MDDGKGNTTLIQAFYAAYFCGSETIGTFPSIWTHAREEIDENDGTWFGRGSLLPQRTLQILQNIVFNGFRISLDMRQR